MAFVDTVLAESDSRIVMIDRRDHPGGHWNDAYPFVRLHQPAAFYGVPSRPLGAGRKYSDGVNAGLHELSSKSEILDYFNKVMHETFLPTGRVAWLPKTEYAQEADGRHLAMSVIDGSYRAIRARRLVDATTANVEIPSNRQPSYDISPDMTVIPVNGLAELKRGYRSYTVVGAGKTGMDACIWLLERHVPASRIRWIVPNDPWLIPRERNDTYDSVLKTTANSFEQMAEAQSVDALFAALEHDGLLMRLDMNVWPTGYRCAVVSHGELAELRKIEDVVRLGRLKSIGPERILLEHGEMTAQPDTLYVDCSASALQSNLGRPVFETGTINLQFVRWCQPLFSAALIGFVECNFEDDGERNRLCAPVRLPREPADWLHMWRETLANMTAWQNEPKLMAWINACRLNSLSALRALDPEAAEHDGLIPRVSAAMVRAIPALQRLLA